MFIGLFKVYVGLFKVYVGPFKVCIGLFWVYLSETYDSCLPLSVFFWVKESFCSKALYNAPQHFATHCNALHQTETHCKTLTVGFFWNALQNSDCRVLLKRTVTHCNTLQHTATHGNTLQHFAILSSYGYCAMHFDTLQHTATLCNALNHTATRCNTLIVGLFCNALQHIATHCSTLQRTASSYCIALQYCYGRTLLQKRPINDYS